MTTAVSEQGHGTFSSAAGLSQGLSAAGSISLPASEEGSRFNCSLAPSH